MVVGAGCAAWRCSTASCRTESSESPAARERSGTQPALAEDTKPAVPNPEPDSGTQERPAQQKPSTKVSKQQRKRAEAAAAARAAGETGPLNRKGRRLGQPTPCGGTVECGGCGTAFPSRNAMFRHVRATGCGGEQVQRVERYVVLYGYVGTEYFGSQRNAQEDEARCPTLEGTLLAAIRAAIMRHEAAKAVNAEVHSRASRTDRGVHALANVLHVKIVTDFEKGSAAPPPLDCELWLEAIRAELPPNITVLKRFDLAKQPDMDVRRACQKREYRYYVPYRALLTSEEKSVAVSSVELETRVWVCGLPDICDADVLRDFAAARWTDAAQSGKEAPLRDVVLSDHPGSATLHMSSRADAEHMASVMDGAVCLPSHRFSDLHSFPYLSPSFAPIACVSPSRLTALMVVYYGKQVGFPGAEPKGLMALLETDAVVRRAAHQRLRDALRLLTGTRSFHNFCPHFHDSSDGAPQVACESTGNIPK